MPEGGRRTVRDWLVDLLLFAAAVAFWVNEWVNAAPAPEAAQADWVVAIDPWLGALACAPLWWRRRFPLVLAWATLPVFLLAGTATGAAIVLIFTVAVHRTWLAASIVTAPYAFMAAWYGYAFPDPDMGRVPTVVFTTLMFASPLGWGIAIRSRRQLVVTLRRDAERVRNDHEARVREARRTERERIAREMHDVLAHRLSLLAMHAGALGYRTAQAQTGEGPPLDTPEVGDAATVIRENANGALAELGDVLNVLRWGTDDATAPQPHVTGIAALVEEARHAGQRVEYDPGAVVGQTDSIRPQAQRTVYRLVQEGLTNARKHAPGAAVAVSLAGEPGAELSVIVTNPLPTDPVAPAPGAEIGLAGLAERVALDGGRLEHGARAGRFELNARLPWPHDRAADRTGPGAARR